MIRKHTLLLLLGFLIAGQVQAQSWQWGRAISCDSDLLSVSGFHYFRANDVTGIIDITSDEAGNTYGLQRIASSHVKVDGRPESGYGGVDILLTSFSCEGRYRWSRLIGSSSDSDVAVSVKASVESGVFVAGAMNLVGAGGGHFGNDTTVANLGKTMFVAKWDTAGHFQWLHLPQPDTMSHYSAWNLSHPADMDMGPDGTLYLLTCLSPGAYEGGNYIVPTLGTHVLKYSSGGQFLGGVLLPLACNVSQPYQYMYSICRSRLRYDGTNGRFIVSGNAGFQSIVIGGTTLGDAVSFVGSFNAATGALGWLKLSNPVRQVPYLTSQVIFVDAPQIDVQGNVYLAGHSNDSGVFNGVLFRNPAHTRIGVDFVTKLDAGTGKALWTTMGRVPNGDLLGLAHTGNKLAITGSYTDSLIFPAALLTNNPATDSNDAFIVQMDTRTGAVQKMASLTGLSDTRGNLITSDRRGNFYVTEGYSSASQPVGPDALTINNYFNFFIAKWGWANCSCTPPVAALVQSASVGMAQAFSYTGTGTGLDSLVWDFGDGSTQKMTSGYTGAVLHTYAAVGHYTVCVTAYDESCGGSSTACLPIALAVGSLSALPQARVYPNPTQDILHIEGLPGGEARLYNTLGQELLRAPLPGRQQQLDIHTLPPGLYLLRLRDQEGNSGAMRLEKR